MASIPFCQMVRSSGLAEPWTHENEKQKFMQFGWRCTTKESSFGNNTLIGNWNEDRFDVREVTKPNPLPSQYGHYFETTYNKSCSVPVPNPAAEVRDLKRQPPCSFPGHQPAFDTAEAQATYNSWATSYRSAYGSNSASSNKTTVAAPDQLTGGGCEQSRIQISHLGARAGHFAPGNGVITAPHPGPGTCAPSK